MPFCYCRMAFFVFCHITILSLLTMSEVTCQLMGIKKGNRKVPCENVFAEGEGFKPPIPERGIPDFESSAIDHSANLPIFQRASATVLAFAAAKVQ